MKNARQGKRQQEIDLNTRKRTKSIEIDYNSITLNNFERLINNNKKNRNYMEIKVSSSQFNYTYGNRIHLPYSIALLVSYIKTKEKFSQFRFEKTFVFRNEEKIEGYVEQCRDSDILLCSCYVWNWEITTLLAKKIREVNPKCLIVFGGPQVPEILEDFFEKYPFVDILVHGEGEIIFENILSEYLKERNYLKIKGISTKDFTTEPQERIKDFDSMPSPYLTNTVFDLVDIVDDYQWIASWETNRGCPYQCTFCDWGSATATTMRKWSEERLYKEIEWFGDHKIPYIDLCDANFGIFRDRDLQIAKKLGEEKLKKGFPETIQATWAKISSEKIIPLAKEMMNAGLLKAVTLSLQSLDKNTLDIVKRANLKFSSFSNLTTSFRDANIPTYTELIMGLPGETLVSFKKGLETILSDKDLGGLQIYNCGLLPNAPMNYPEYREKNKIKSIRSPIYLQHTRKDEISIQEYERIVIETFSFNLKELKEMWRYSWMVQTFHTFGILELVAKFYQNEYKLPLMEFYETLLQYGKNEKSFFSKEFYHLEKHLDKGYSGKGWSHYDLDLGEISWTLEEASAARFLRLDTNILFTEIQKFVKFLENKKEFHSRSEILNDLIKFQIFLLTTRENLEEIKEEKFVYGWKDYFVNNSAITKSKVKYFYKNKITEKDPIKWIWDVVWYGRKEIKYKMYPELLQVDSLVINEIVH